MEYTTSGILFRFIQFRIRLMRAHRFMCYVQLNGTIGLLKFSQYKCLVLHVVVQLT